MVSELLKARTHPSEVCDTLLCHAAMSPAMTVYGLFPWSVFACPLASK